MLTLPFTPADWAKSKVPVILSADEEMRLRSHYPSNHESGVRNNIIIRLMLDLGLWCAEVSDLSINDIIGITVLSASARQKTCRAENCQSPANLVHCLSIMF